MKNPINAAYSPDFLRKAINLFLVTFTIIQTYGAQHYNFAFIGTLVLLAWFIIKRGRIPFNAVPKYLLIYFGYHIFVYYYSGLYGQLERIVPLGIIKTILTFSLFFSEFDQKLFIRYVRIVGSSAIAFFILQEVSYYIYGYRMSGLIPGLPLALDIDDYSVWLDKVKTMNRSSSFFSEPAHFVQFLLPWLAVELFSKLRNRYSLKLAIIITLVLLLLQSGNAFFGLVTIYGVLFIVYIRKSLSSLKRIMLLTVIFAISIFGVSKYMSSEIGRRMLDRGQKELGNEMENVSGFVRIYRGYYVYAEYTILQKVTGVENIQHRYDCISASEVSFMFAQDDLYMNCIQDILIRTGLIGMTLMIMVFLDIGRKTDLMGRVVLLLFVVLSFISSLYLTPMMLICLNLANSNISQK